MKRPHSPAAAPRWTNHVVAPDEAGRTVQEILTGPMRISRRMIQRLTRAQGILLNRRPAYLARKVKEGDTIAVRAAAEEESGLVPFAMELSIAYEDGDVLVVDKPPYMLVHPVAPHHTATLAHGVAHHLAERGIRAKVHPVHRIDRDTSGLVLFANTSVAHHRLDLQLRDHTLRREYLAFVEGVIADEQGVIDAPIGAHPVHPNLRAVRERGEEARTRYRVVERFADATLVALELETGRTHQIRVHLAHLGHPLVADRQYGARPTPLLQRQALHSARLSFLHPTTQAPITVEAPLPDDLQKLKASYEL